MTLFPLTSNIENPHLLSVAAGGEHDGIDERNARILRRPEFFSALHTPRNGSGGLFCVVTSLLILRVPVLSFFFCVFPPKVWQRCQIDPDTRHHITTGRKEAAPPIQEKKEDSGASSLSETSCSFRLPSLGNDRSFHDGRWNDQAN